MVCHANTTYNGRMETTSVPLLEILEQVKLVVLDSLTSTESKRIYGRGITRFLAWFQSEHPSTGFTKAIVQSFRSHLIASRLSSSAVNLYLTAIRRLAVEAADIGLLPNEVAAAIRGIKRVRREGVRTGKWLTV